MSGIVGILREDGAPLTDAAVQAATVSMAFRAPHGRRVWCEGPVGLGHALLTTYEDERTQPGVAGSLAIVADARLDDRAALRARLRDAGERDAGSDAELILSAYRAWGHSAVERLLGDFAFVLWDGARRRLVAACDHLGLRQIYYARRGGTLVVTNTIAAARAAVDVSDELDERSVGDFLLFGANLRPDATIYRHLSRLPGGHVLEWADGRLTITRYWALPRNHDLLHFRRPGDCVERFRDLLQTAVGDRIRRAGVALSMSGGMDSTTMAAAAAPAAAAAGAPAPVAYTLVYDRVIRHEERPYAGLAAEALGLPIEFVACDDAVIPADSSYETARWAEPTFRSFFPADVHFMATIAQRHSLLFSGEGADAVMASSPRYYRYLLERGRWLRLASELLTTTLVHRLVPPTSIGGWLRRKQSGVDPLPSWLSPAFVARAGLAERWHERHAPSPQPHPHRPGAYRQLTGAPLARYLEHADAGMTGLPLDIVHPFLDLRVVDFLLSVPQLPWAVRKHLARTATAGVLPGRVRLRPKTTLADDPVIGAMSEGRAHGITKLPWAPGIERFLLPEVLSVLATPRSSVSLFRTYRAFALNAWCLAHHSTSGEAPSRH